MNYIKIGQHIINPALIAYVTTDSRLDLADPVGGPMAVSAVTIGFAGGATIRLAGADAATFARRWGAEYRTCITDYDTEKGRM